MPATYETIATAIADGTSATITFSSIPATYTDLVVIAQFRSGTTGTYTDSYIRLATGGGSVDTGSNYSATRVYSSTTSYSSVRYNSATLMYFVLCTSTGSGADILTNGIAYINDYANTTTYKNSLVKGGDSNTYVSLGINTWRNTGAVTSVAVITNSSFINGSTFALYGIKAA